jgi:glutamyl-tRNA synthetase
MTRYLFDASLDHTEAAQAQLKQESVAATLQELLKLVPSDQSLTAETAQELIGQVTKAANVKKGLVMKSLRAALTCDMHGPDLIQSWLLLHQQQMDRARLEKGVAIASDP